MRPSTHYLRPVLCALVITSALCTDVAAQNEPPGASLNQNIAITKTKSRTIAVPEGTTILVQLDRALSSQSDKTDDTFTFTAAQNVVVKGMLIVAKGAVGGGHILSATKAGMFGKSGQLAPSFDYITAVDGEKIRMSGTQSSYGGQNAEAQAGTAVAGGLAESVIPFAGLGSLAMGGKKAEIGTERPYPIYVAETVDIASDKAAKIDDGFAHAHEDADSSGDAAPAKSPAHVRGNASAAHGSAPIAVKNVSVIDEGLLTFVCVNFVNNGASTVDAVRLQIQTFNAFKEKNEDVSENLSGSYAPGSSTHVPTNAREMQPYLLSIASHSPCAQLMPTSKITSAQVTPIKAGFSDGTVWEGKGTTVSSDAT